MCTSPVSIINRSLRFDPVAKPFVYHVPCGKCLECKDKANSEWFVRSYFEYRTCKKQGGSVFFYTLTFSDEHLPCYKGVNVFRGRDIDLFIKRLRASLWRNFHCKLRYLITSEYGDERGRSHYHILLFFDMPMLYVSVYRLVLDAWSLGFVKPGRLNHGEVLDFRGIKYVCKYISKSDRWTDYFKVTLQRLLFIRYVRLASYLYNKYKHYDVVYFLHSTFRLAGFKSFLSLFAGDEHLSVDNFVATIKSRYSLDFDSLFRLGFQIRHMMLFLRCFHRLVQKFKQSLRSYSPFHRQSLGLGASMLQYVEDYDLDKEEVYLHTNSDNSVQTLPLPRFFKRMLWYNRVENPRDGKRTLFELNELGIQHRIKKVKDDMSSQTAQLFTDLNTIRHLSPARLRSLFSTVKHLSSFIIDDDEFIFFVHNCDVDLRVLYLYRSCFRDRVAVVDVPDNKDEFLSDWSRYIEDCYTLESGLSYNYHDYSPKQIQSFLDSLYNHKSFFKPYEYVSQILDAFASYSRTIRAADLAVRRANIRNLKRIANGLCPL